MNSNASPLSQGRPGTVATMCFHSPWKMAVFVAVLSCACAAILSYFPYLYSCVAVSAALLCMLFVLRPEWALYFLAATRISLDAVRFSSSLIIDIDARSGLSLDGVVNALVLVYFLSYLIFRKRARLSQIPGCTAYLAFIAFCALGLPLSTGKLIGLRHLLHQCTFFALYILSVTILDTRRKNRMMIGALVISTAIPLIMGAYQLFAAAGLDDPTGLIRIYGTASHPNGYAVYLLTMTLFLFVLFLNAESIVRKAVFLVCMALVSCSLILTCTRSAWIGCFLGIVILTLASVTIRAGKAVRSLAAALVTEAAIVVCLFPLIRERLLELVTFGMGSLGWRTGMWQAGLAEFARAPLTGHGIGSSLVFFERLYGSTLGPHNDFLKLLIESGIVGFVMYGAILWALMRYGISTYLSAGLTYQGRLFGAGMTAIIAGMLAVQFSDNAMSYDFSFSYFWFVMAVSFNLTQGGTRE